MGPAPRGGAARAAAPPAGQGGPVTAPGPSRPVRARSAPVLPPVLPPLRPPGSVCLQRGRSCRHRYGVGGLGESAETPVSNMGKVGRESERRCLAPPRAPSPQTRPVQPAGSPFRKIAFRFLTRSAEKRVSTLSPRVLFFLFHCVRGGGHAGAGAVAAPTDLGLPTAPRPPTHPGAPTRRPVRGLGSRLRARERGRERVRAGAP